MKKYTVNLIEKGDKILVEFYFYGKVSELRGTFIEFTEDDLLMELESGKKLKFDLSNMTSNKFYKVKKI